MFLAELFPEVPESALPAESTHGGEETGSSLAAVSPDLDPLVRRNSAVAEAAVAAAVAAAAAAAAPPAAQSVEGKNGQVGDQRRSDEAI